MVAVITRAAGEEVRSLIYNTVLTLELEIKRNPSVAHTLNSWKTLGITGIL